MTTCQTCNFSYPTPPGSSALLGCRRLPHWPQAAVPCGDWQARDYASSFFVDWSALAPGGTFVVERGSPEAVWPGAPVEPEIRRYGTTVLHIFRKTDGGLDGASEASDRD